MFGDELLGAASTECTDVALKTHTVMEIKFWSPSRSGRGRNTFTYV